MQVARANRCCGSAEGSTKRGIDVEIGQLLTAWAPRIGEPTCGPGCSGCCERMTVIVSSAEALAIVDEAPAITGRIGPLMERLTPDATLDDLLDLGPCVYLENGKCMVYASRPDACRACYVWHDSAYCGHPNFDMCVPSELNHLRLLSLRERMTREFELGRRPFRGYLLPVVSLLAKRREAYLGGEDLRRGLDPRWLRHDLLEFPTRAQLRKEADDLDQVFDREYNPMGFPRAERAKDRSLLEAFDLRD